MGHELSNPHGKVDKKLVIGALLFGLGWGIGSMCPGPVLMQGPVFEFRVHGLWLIGCLMGMFMAKFCD